MDSLMAITIKPKLGYWIGRFLVIIIIMVSCPLCIVFVPEEEIIHYALLVAFLIIWLMLFYTYLDMLFATKWIVTEDEILSYQGIFYRKVDHLELYRITDYSERQSFLQLIFRNKTVVLTSGDPSHPVMYLYGIEKKISIIEILRERVENQKNKRGIYEVTNRI